MTVNLDMIKEARERLEGVAHLTPIFTARGMNPNLSIKMENLQRTGSFKLRGAYNKIANLTEEEKNKGVITSSAGNHAQGVALSATEQGIKSYICIPSVAPLAKIKATRNYGGEVIIVDGDFDDAKDKSYEIQKEKDLTYVHPFDDEYVIAGQGTIGLEILEQMPDVDTVIAPIGGGGLLAGIALAIKSVRPDVRVVGVESENAACMKTSIEAGQIETLCQCGTIADGIAVKTPGELTYKIIKEHVDEIVTVSECEIYNAILRLLEESKVTAEGAGATSVAAVINNKLNLRDDEKVCAVLSGGNINVNTINKVITKGLFQSGRLAEFTLSLEDSPGQMVKLLNIISDMGANIQSLVQYESTEMPDIEHRKVRVILETFDIEHKREVLKKISDAGYEINLDV